MKKAVARDLEALLRQRIVVIDGAMGTMIQGHRLGEEDYRGQEFAAHARPLKGCNDVLCLTQPQIVEGIHRAYLEAGADIVETNTFNSTSLSLADYGLEDRAYDLNVAGARVARRAADAVEEREGRPCIVAGALGPTNKSAAQSTDSNNPGARNVTFDALEAAYRDQVRGLVDGGADVLLVETAFDTLNMKAALFAIERLFEETGVRLPVMASGTIVDLSGRTMTGQTVEAFWASSR
jgi:5-methyltetrahydrofolate--homocysteine methyltransferase